MKQPGEDRIRHFEAFAASLRPVFHRADQALRFRAYLRGLIEPLERKNVEALAMAATGAMLVEANLGQALQHFVSQSPWDSERLFSALRAQTRHLRHDPGAVWLVHDAVFPKKGHHSVGVFRQFARAEGKKINCQVAVFVSQVGPLGFYPLGIRLYLPANWIRDNGPLAEKIIPSEHCRAVSKQEIALGLLEQLKKEGEHCAALQVEPGYLSGNLFGDLLSNKVSTDAHDWGKLFQRAHQHLGWLKSELGLDHFEGRTWLGWHHHAALVFAAYYLLATENPLAGSLTHPPFGNS